MRFPRVGRKTVIVQLIRVAKTDGGVVLFVEQGAERGEADGGFDGEVRLVGQGAGAVVGGQLGGHVEAVGDEVVGVALEEGAVRVRPCGGGDSFGVSVGEDEDVARFFDGLLLGLSVIVADGVGVGGADVVDCPWLRRGIC